MTTKDSAAAPTSTHGTLKSLLTELESLQVSTIQTDSSIVLDETKLLKSVTLLHEALLEMNFSEALIHEMLIQTRAASLEACLDWACWHIPTPELPAFLTDQDALVDSIMTRQDPHRLTVVAAKPQNVTNGSNESKSITDSRAVDTSVLLTISVKAKSNDETSDDNVDKAAQKAWLLSQYEYEDDEDVTSNDDRNEINTSTMSPLELELHNMELEYKELSSILKDETQQYMMSKHEIKEARKKSKMLQKLLSGLRRKVQQEQVRKEQEVEKPADGAAEASADDSEDDKGMAFVDIFGGAIEDEDELPTNATIIATQSTSPQTPSVPPPSPIVTLVPDYSIPSNWTGTTPVQVLKERCNKLKCGPPQFQKRGTQNGGIITVKYKPKPIIVEDEGPFRDWTLEGRNYLATKALYEMDSSLPLYRLLPPAFRDLWTSWVNAAKEEQEAKERGVLNAKEEKMRGIVKKILSCQSKATGKSEGKVGDAIDEDEMEDVSKNAVPDTWDDSESDAEPTTNAEHSQKEVTAEGIKLQTFFRSRQETPHYQSMLEARKVLPMYSYRQQLLDTIQDNTVTVLCAETGAGKTTQCGQFLLETALQDGFGDKISMLCTQPRRVSAISVAERVSDEFGDNHVGETIGYHIRLESRRSTRTKLLFCTTGVVLRRLQDDPNLEGVTHVLVDEVHERQWQIDFLLIALRRLIATTRTDLKVVLMSATLDAKLFTQFFPGAPLLKVPGRTFPVANYYLEDLMDATDHVIEEGSRYALRNRRDDDRSGSLWVTTKGGAKRRENFSMNNDAHLAEISEDYVGYKMSTRRSMDRVNEQVVNYDLIEDVLMQLLVNPETSALKPPDSNLDISAGAVLIFLPGAGEINTLRERLEGSRTFGNRKRFDVIPMHSTLSPKDQRRAFVKSKRGCQKLILATNIAETSVTIPDVVCVIDSGLVREVHQNKRTSTSTLVTTWCSRASIKQRSGRAGRVQAGICCRLFSSRTAKDRMKDQAVPELQRVPLEEVCLSILAGRLGNSCMDFLQQAPQPPSEKSVSLALEVLQEVGAIDSHEQLTSLGYHLSKLPMDVRLGKILIFGALFRCLDPILTVAASLSCKSPFPAYAKDSLEAQARHKTFQHGSSDFMTICNVFKAFQEAAAVGKSRSFCDDNFVSRSALTEIKDTRDQYLNLLCQIGFVSMVSKGPGVPPEYNMKGMKESVVHAVICAGLYPNVAHVDSVQSGVASLTHNKERVHIHKSSVNAAKNSVIPSNWIAFYEKFATHRVYISDTALVHPFSLLLFGGPLMVKHQVRKVLVGEWIEVPIAAQTGVLFRELRVKLDDMLKQMIEEPHQESNDLINGIVRLIETH